MKKIIFTGLVSVMTIMAVTSIMWKLKQADSGICSRTGTRLNDVELRQAVIASLISIGLDNVHHQDVEYSRGTVKLRIIDQISDVDIAKAIFELKNGSDFFARYSDAKEIERLPSDHDSNPIKEPFILFNYSTYGGYMATRTASSDIDYVDRASLELDEEYPGLLIRLKGFGVHYYKIPSLQFIYDCCAYINGNRTRPAIPGLGRHYWESGRSGSVIIGRQNVGGVAYVSNCGEILTSKNRRGFNEIKWIKGE